LVQASSLYFSYSVICNYSYTERHHLCVELNGKPIVPGLVLTGSQITTPAANRNFFLPPAIPNTLIRKLEVSSTYTEPVNNCAALSTLASLDDDQHEEPQQEQTSLSKELVNTSAEFNMFSRIQRSKSRQKNIEKHRCGRDQTANSGSCDGIQDGMNKSLGAVGSNTNTVSASSRSFGDAANNTKTTSSCPGQGAGSVASQGRLTNLLKCHNNLGSQGNQLDCLPSLALENKIICSDNNSAARDLKMVPLPDSSELNIGDTTCHAMSGTHLLVEPKKLQFDSTESVCMGPTSEEMGRRQESALESDHFGVADQNHLSEDTYPANSSQELHYMDRSSLDGLKSDYLKGVNADLKHKQYGLESCHHDLSFLHSLNEEPSLNCSPEIPSFVGDPLLQETTLYVPENSSKLSRTQAMGPLQHDEIKCSEISHSVVNPLLEKDTSQALEDTKETDCSNPKVSPPPSSGPLQLPIQLADASFKANASSGVSMNNLLGEDGHNHISNLLTNDTNSRCSLGLSSVSVVQLPPQTFTLDNVCQSSPLSCGTSNGAHSNGFAAVDAFESAENMLPQDQYLLARSSFEFDRGIAYADASSDHPPPAMHNEMLVGNLKSELVNCPSGKLCVHVHVNKTHDSSIENKMGQFVVPKVVSSVSSGRTRKMQKGERGSATPSGKCNRSLQQEGILIAARVAYHVSSHF
jgi:hypothetical protein